MVFDLIWIFLFGCERAVTDIDDQSNSNTSFVNHESEAESSESENSSNEKTESIIIDSLTAVPVIKMPYTPSFTATSGEDFIAAMANNPLDKAFSNEWETTDGNDVTMLNLVLDKYAGIWQDEIDYAIEALDTRLDESYMEVVNNYAVNFLENAWRKINFEQSAFLDMDKVGMYMGTSIRYAISTQILDTYRELTFTLKYWMYLIETEGQGENEKADLSLKFIYKE